MKSTGRRSKKAKAVEAVMQFVEDEIARIVATDPRINLHAAKAAARDARVRARGQAKAA